MLILQAEICFNKQEDSQYALHHDLNTQYIIRPVINWGNNQLFSGTILPDKNIEMLKRGQIYNVIIEMPTIEKEAYDEIKPLIYSGREFKIQMAARVIGGGKILEYIYE